MLFENIEDYSNSILVSCESQIYFDEEEKLKNLDLEPIESWFNKPHQRDKFDDMCRKIVIAKVSNMNATEQCIAESLGVTRQAVSKRILYMKIHEEMFNDLFLYKPRAHKLGRLNVENLEMEEVLNGFKQRICC